ncbi:hypothetical protein THIOKS13320052 [Thiocapsa sp. KS1]|nr:hypothetical protein THIOKS13320052 [Thiocapsa sp. KS1]
MRCFVGASFLGLPRGREGGTLRKNKPRRCGVCCWSRLTCDCTIKRYVDLPPPKTYFDYNKSQLSIILS